MLDKVRAYRASLGTLVAQLFFIAAGVYLGNRADNWKEERAHREAARAALVNFRTELAGNRKRVADALPYHRAMRDSLLAVWRTARRSGVPPAPTIFDVFDRVGFNGLHYVELQDTAWELSLATQSLSYLPPALAFEIAGAYQNQRTAERFQATAVQNIASPTALGGGPVMATLVTVASSMADFAAQDSALVRRYDVLAPRLDSASAKLPK